MNPLTIEIYGTGTHNRGAELMAAAIAERMQASFPGARLVVSPEFGDFDARARYHFWTTWEFTSGLRMKMFRHLERHAPSALRVSTRDLDSLLQGWRFAPLSVRKAAGVVAPSEIDLVLDASGFAVSDDWGPHKAQRLVDRMSGRARKGKPLILLPQAFGPFTRSDVRLWAERLLCRSSLVFARDARSRAALSELEIVPNRIKLAPDFTLSVEPRLPDGLTLPSTFSAIVPNMRMMDKCESDHAYLDFIARSIALSKQYGLTPVFVLHDAVEDRLVIDRIRNEGLYIPLMEHPDPRALKAILGQAALVVGSRFHALVGALSQGVPCIGAGWSHKYQELFTDFGCPELLVSKLDETGSLEDAFMNLSTAALRGAFTSKILAAGGRMEAKTEAMWVQVEEAISSGIEERQLNRPEA